MRRTHTLLAAVFLLLLSSPAYAGYDEQDSPPDLFCEPGNRTGGNPAFGGKPVSLLSGMETYAPSTDLALGSLYPIRVTRSYNSRTSYDSPLGYGWAINYDKRLYTYSDDSVTVRKECGGKKRFTWSVGGYVGKPGETLVQNPDGTYTYTDKNGEKENYDVQGRIASQVDATGNSLVFTYAAPTRDPLWGLLPANIFQNTTYIVAYDYRLSKVEEKDAAGSLTGNWVSFQYDTMTGRLSQITDSAGRTVSYTHDPIGNLATASGPYGSSSYGYTDATRNHLLTSIDEGQGAYVNTYDASGRVTRQTHGTGVIDFEYTIPYQKTVMTTTITGGANGPLIQTRTVEFDANGMAGRVIDTYGNVTAYTRDGNTRLLREEHWENTGAVTSPNLVLRSAEDYTYDTKGNMLTKTEAQGTALEKTTTYTYHPTFNKVATETVKSVVDPVQNRVITNTYDETNGNLLTTTETGLLGNGTPYTYTTGYTYNSNGKVTNVDGPRTDVNDATTYTYDPVTGFLTALTQPLVGTTAYGNHDALGNPRIVTDPNGNSTIYTYDTTGRVSTVKAPGDTAATQYFYVSGCGQSCSGKLDHIVLPEGNTIWYTYDTFGNLITIRDNLNNSINYTYDSEGNRLTEEIRDSSGALQKGLSYEYDALNRLARIKNPDQSYTQYEYDFRGNRKRVKAPARTVDEKTIYSYDALNRLIAVLQPVNVDTSYEYNSNNNLTSVQDDNTNTTQYKYDDKGRVYQVISPDTGTTTYGYDPAGNLTSKTDAKGVTISYAYDALNRLTTIDFSADTDIVYAYDSCVNGKGRLCSMTDASGTTVYEYSAKGQIKKETKTIDSIQYVTQYTYDQNGNLKTMTYPSGRVVTFNYTNDHVSGVLNNAANLASNINYKPFGGMSSFTYGNGLSGSINYDNQYRITGITAGTVMNLSYPNYDANGNITAINNVLDPTKNKSFTYDSLDRLSTATASGIWGSLSWTYDGVGNRQTEGATSYTYLPGTNKLNTVGGASYGFDNNGNTTAEGARQFIYNQNQRLIRVVDAGVTKGEYTYNGSGQRIKKVVNGVTTIFHYSRYGQLIAETDATGAVSAEYVYLNGQPLARIEGSNTYFYVNDHLGTPQKMMDSTGAIVWSANYKPFGEVTIDPASTITNNLRLLGQYFDTETSLHYNYMRDYNPVIGRYIESDPIGIQKGTNHLYIYVRNNPLSMVDPEGLTGWPFPGEPDMYQGWITTNVNSVTYYTSALMNLGSQSLPSCAYDNDVGRTAAVLRGYSYPGLLPDQTTTTVRGLSCVAGAYIRERTVTKRYNATITYSLYKCTERCRIFSWKYLGDMEVTRLWKTTIDTITEQWSPFSNLPPAISCET